MIFQKCTNIGKWHGCLCNLKIDIVYVVPEKSSSRRRAEGVSYSGQRAQNVHGLYINYYVPNILHSCLIIICAAVYITVYNKTCHPLSAIY